MAQSLSARQVQDKRQKYKVKSRRTVNSLKKRDTEERVAPLCEAERGRG